MSWEWIAEKMAREFYLSEQRLGPELGVRPREESPTPWEQVSEEEQQLLIAIFQNLLERGVITAGT